MLNYWWQEYLLCHFSQILTFVKYTTFHLGILLVKIEGVLLLRMDLWRTEEGSTRPLICILCLK